MEIRIEYGKDVLKIAAQLSRQLNYHLFHAYYHALAIFHGGFFVTSDNAYTGKRDR